METGGQVKLTGDQPFHVETTNDGDDRLISELTGTVGETVTDDDHDLIDDHGASGLLIPSQAGEFAD